DLLHAVRQTGRRPGFSLVVVLTLGLGIGANTVIFDLLNLVIWQRPPVSSPDELVRIHTRSRAEWIGPYGNSSYADYRDYRAGSKAFAGLAALVPRGHRLETAAETRSVQAGLVSDNYFGVLGLDAILGRLLTSQDSKATGPPPVVLSHDLWQRSFAADESVPGTIVELDGEAFTVVGVAAAGFYGTYVGHRIDLWYPIEHNRSALAAAEKRDRIRTAILGRLAPGVAPQQALQAVSRIAARLDEAHPLNERQRDVTVAPLTLMHPLDRRNFLPTVRVLLVAVALLLLITCANVANLLLARNASRGRELGVRAALGAGRGRLARQLFAESLVLAIAGGLTGLLVALWGRRLVALCLGTELADLVAELRFDGRVLGLCLLVCLASAWLSALAPVRAVTRADLVRAIQSGSLVGRARGRPGSIGHGLGAIQVALATVLLVTTGLLGQSLWNLWRADPGFDTENLVSAHVAMDTNNISREAVRLAQSRLVEHAAALPGVRDAGLALLVPPVRIDINTDFRLFEQPDTKHSARRNVVDGGFFDTLGIPLLAGRHFSAADGENDRGVVLVNRTLAQSLWPGEEAIGQILLVAQYRPWMLGPEYEVVGVVGDTVQDSFDSPSQPILYFSAEQRSRSAMDLVLRTEMEPAAFAASLGETLRRLDPSLTVEWVHTHQESRWSFLTLERIRTLILAAFAGLGLLLSIVGVGSLLSYSVSRRWRGLGVRCALGARRADLRRLVLRRGLKTTAIGLAAGLVAAWWIAQLLRSFLFGVGTADPRIFTGVPLILLAAALIAAWIPARRASSVDPLVALRHGD
ncbi:MAG: ABC transporter permease, partial [Acidobacteriota bacterium]